MTHAGERITQEVARLGGSCAHVTEESVTSHQDDATGEFWLSGTFRFVMYVHGFCSWAKDMGPSSRKAGKSREVYVITISVQRSSRDCS